MPSITSFHRLAIGAAAGALSALHAVPAAAKDPVVLPYFLPKTVVSATFSQRLTSCPDDPARSDADNTRERVKVLTKWTLSADVVPDYSMPILIDASSGFLAKRNVGIKYNADGTLNSLNADSAGQGGAILASVIKLAGTVIPLLSTGGPVKGSWSLVVTPGSLCTPAARAVLKKLEDINGKIAKIQDDIADKTATAAQVAALADFQTLRLALEAALTIKSPESFDFDPDNPDQVTPLNGKLGDRYFAPLNYSGWFGKQPPPDYIAGATFGMVATVGVDEAALKARRLRPAVPRPAGDWSPQPQQKMYFRWPVPASVSVIACANALKLLCLKDAKLTAAMTNTSLDFSMPQLAYLTAIPVGSAGIFGSRTVKASFDETGAPVELSYGSDPGADAIAGTIDAAGGTAVAIHDRKLAALKYQLDLEETKAKLAAARAAAKEE